MTPFWMICSIWGAGTIGTLLLFHWREATFARLEKREPQRLDWPWAVGAVLMWPGLAYLVLFDTWLLHCLLRGFQWPVSRRGRRRRRPLES